MYGYLDHGFNNTEKTYAIVIDSDEEYDGRFVGRCDELHANSQKETYGEIMKNMKETVELASKKSGNIEDFSMLVVQE